MNGDSLHTSESEGEREPREPGSGTSIPLRFDSEFDEQDDVRPEEGDGEPPADLPLVRPAGYSASSGVKNRRRLLIISYYFPPSAMNSVLRIAKFTKYLSGFGWDPTVLTVGDSGHGLFDYSLLEEVLESGAQIERTRTIDPARIMNSKGIRKLPMERYRGFLRGVSHTFLQPDNKIGWKRYALKRALELHERQEFDMVLATAPPFTDFLVGTEFQERFGTPLVVDYRAPWVDNRESFYATPLHRSYASGLEHEVLKNADAVVVVNRRIKERLIARYQFLTHDTVHILPTGYDPHDFQVARRFPVARSSRMRITYCGSLDTRHTPKHFFSALARIFAKHPETRDHIEVSFVGPFPDAFRKMALNLGVSSALVTPGFLEHSEVARYLISSDLLWLSAFDPLSTPDKVYEYMATGRPILALSEPGALRQTLSGYGAATCVDPVNVEAIADAIHDCYLKWASGSLPTGEKGAAREFDQRLLTERLSRILAYALKI